MSQPSPGPSRTASAMPMMSILDSANTFMEAIENSTATASNRPLISGFGSATISRLQHIVELEVEATDEFPMPPCPSTMEVDVHPFADASNAAATTPLEDLASESLYVSATICRHFKNCHCFKSCLHCCCLELSYPSCHAATTARLVYSGSIHLDLFFLFQITLASTQKYI